MKYIILCLNLLLSLAAQAQTIPYNLNPEWQSTPQGHVATGLGIADINGDGWKDIIVANGNDISRQRLVVYYNQGDGTFPLTPGWQSDDIDYHGHLAVGDINKDGWMDVAVSVYLGAGGFGTKGKVKVYYNTGGELESIPSFQSNPFYTFSCTLGDADADGDLDLAVACSEPYSEEFDQGRIFFNEEGEFNIENVWFSTIEMGALDVEFGDIDGNGYMDVVFICESTPNYIFLGDQNGQIATSPSWQSSELTNFINSVDIGRTHPDQVPYIVMTGNDQLGGDGKIRQYLLGMPFPSASYATWLSAAVGYGSGILLADVTRDDHLDLIYGGWWLPVEILEGDGQGFNAIPSYTSTMTSVVEAIQMADLGKETLVFTQDEILVTAQQHVIYLSHQIIDDITGILINGVPVDETSYTFVPDKNWISFEYPLSQGDLIVVSYTYCLDGDLIISNWDSNKGNFIYYNTSSPVAINNHCQTNQPLTVHLFPNPVTDILQLSLGFSSEADGWIRIYSVQGTRLHCPQHYFNLKGPVLYPIDVSALPPGVYFLEIITEHDHTFKKFCKN